MENIQQGSILKHGQQLIRVKGVSGQFEETIVPMDAAMGIGDPSLQQEKEDSDLLKNVGDSYTRIQKGTIISGDGETKIEVDLQFTRTRNKHGGIDVNCLVPCLATLPEMTMGRP